jgi:hypothetical protein
MKLVPTMGWGAAMVIYEAFFGGSGDLNIFE